MVSPSMPMNNGRATIPVEKPAEQPSQDKLVLYYSENFLIAIPEDDKDTENFIGLDSGHT